MLAINIGKTVSKYENKIFPGTLVYEQDISNLEKGRVNLTARNIDDICSTYNINQVWLETGEGDIFSELTKNDEFNILVGKLVAEEDSFKKKVIEEMLKLDDEDWLFIEKFVSKIKS